MDAQPQETLIIPPWVVLLVGLFLMLWIISIVRAVFIKLTDPVRFPRLTPERIRFQEHFASGGPHRMAGSARNCLRITVTDEELWVRMCFPFSLAERWADLRHRIPLSSILSVHPEGAGGAVIVKFCREDGSSGGLTLSLRKRDAFLDALAVART